MAIVTTYLLENNHLVKEGLKSILAGTNYKVADALIDFEDMCGSAGIAANMDLVIYGVDEEIAQMPDFIGRLKALHPDSKIAILGSDTEPQLITTCFAHGADGYLTKNISPDSLVNSLNMIMSGERIYPAVALDTLIKMNRKDKQAAEYNLSARELEILRHIALGETNKEIALERNIAESTVKAHIKTILRKLSLSNRTQAARWAWTEGLIQEIPPESNAYYKQTQSMM